MAFAYKAHDGQMDDDGIPYIFHPARVASGFTDETGACAAWLHDVVEDASYTLEDIRSAGFSDEICTVVALLTHEKDTPYMEYVEKLAFDTLYAEIMRTIEEISAHYTKTATKTDAIDEEHDMVNDVDVTQDALDLYHQ